MICYSHLSPSDVRSIQLRRGFFKVLLLLTLLLVLILFGAGFALHILWIVAVVLLVVWVIVFAIGRGESAGKNTLYRW